MTCTCPNCGQSFDLLAKSDISLHPDDVVHTVRLFYGYTDAELKTPSRVTELVKARNMAYVMLKKYTTLNNSAIARKFGKNHGTVYRDTNRFTEELTTNEKLFAELVRVDKMMQEIVNQ